MHTLLDPAILFFVFGMFAGALKSNLDIPEPIKKFLSLYLLMALGLKGGFALAHSGLNPGVAAGLAAAVFMAFMVPALGYSVLRHVTSRFDAAAVAASYGSVSAVTFVTATQFLTNAGTPFGGHMTAAMVLMESPAIIMAVVLANMARQSMTAPAVVASGGGAAVMTTPGAPGTSIGRILHESFTDGAQLLLIGAMTIGCLSGDAGKAVMQPFTGDLFKGMLAFFLLDMGLMVARNFDLARKASRWLLVYAVAGPVLHAAVALLLAAALGMNAGDATLLMVLSASASYIVVPAVLRTAVPEANPALYFGLSLGITFPLNLLIGIPVYAGAAARVLG